MTLFVGDSLVLITPYECLQNIGITYEVADIRAGLVILKDPISRRAICGIPIETIFDYFKKPENVRKWTSWSVMTDDRGNVIGYYRTNGRKVQYRALDGVRSEACCHRMDQFNIGFGLRLAYLRADAKRVIAKMDEIDKEMTECKSKLSSINQEQKHMIAFLCD